MHLALMSDSLIIVPILALAAVAILALRNRGLLTQELMTELSDPFSRPTLTLIAALLLVWQVLCAMMHLLPRP